jgi:ribosomal protein S27E
MVKFNDYPLEECANEAIKYVKKGASVFQKWTCGHCGSRQTMEEKNQFYRAGICEECGKETVISRCNYTVVFSMGSVP